MSNTTPSVRQTALASIPPNDDTPDVFEQKTKGKMPKAKPPKPKAYGAAKKFKRNSGYRVAQHRRDAEDQAKNRSKR